MVTQKERYQYDLKNASVEIIREITKLDTEEEELS